MSRPLEFEIVVAHYNEDAMIFEDYKSTTTIYTKYDGDKPEFPQVSHLERLPNIGREGHTYLQHIVRHYGKLSEITLFTQARPFDHMDDNITLADLVTQARSTQPGEVKTFWSLPRPFKYWDRIPWFDDELFFYWWTQNAASMQQASCTPGELWKHITDDDQHPEELMAIAGAIFAVHKNTLESVPLAAWKRALEAFETRPHRNPEIGIFMEHFWMALMVPEFRIHGTDECQKRCCTRTGQKLIY